MSKFEEDSGSRRSMFVVRQLVTAIVKDWFDRLLILAPCWRSVCFGRALHWFHVLSFPPLQIISENFAGGDVWNSNITLGIVFVIVRC